MLLAALVGIGCTGRPLPTGADGGAEPVVVCVGCEQVPTCDLCVACRDTGADLAAFCPAGTAGTCDVASVQACVVQVCAGCR